MSYDAEISETLILDQSNIIIDAPKANIFWSQHFLNPHNNLNHMTTDASFEKNQKLFLVKEALLILFNQFFLINIYAMF